MARARFLLLSILAFGGISALAACGDSTFTAGSGNDAGGSDDAGTVDSGPSGTDASVADGGTGNDDGGPTSTVKHVFVTSTKVSGTLGGVNGANTVCQTAAQGAGRIGTYRAWISSTTKNALLNVEGTGPWYLTDETTQVFADRTSFLGAPAHAIDRDESNHALIDASESPVMWTGTEQKGGVSSSTCADWTSSASTNNGSTGNAKDQSWGSGASSPSCDQLLSLICFEK